MLWGEKRAFWDSPSKKHLILDDYHVTKVVIPTEKYLLVQNTHLQINCSDLEPMYGELYAGIAEWYAFSESFFLRHARRYSEKMIRKQRFVIRRMNLNTQLREPRWHMTLEIY